MVCFMDNLCLYIGYSRLRLRVTAWGKGSPPDFDSGNFGSIPSVVVKTR